MLTIEFCDATPTTCRFEPWTLIALQVDIGDDDASLLSSDRPDCVTDVQQLGSVHVRLDVKLLPRFCD